jgi:hypothetical protein
MKIKINLLTGFLFLLTLISGNIYSFSFDCKSVRPDTTYDLINFYECRNDTVIYRKINIDIPSFVFQVKIINSYMYSPVKEIVIKDSATKKTLQTLNSDRDSLFVFNMEFNDYNFDGYLDLYLYDGCAILGNCFGKVFIFNQEKKEFIRDMAFDEMTSVSVNKDKKEIYSFNQCCAGASSTYSVYRYSDGKLYKFKEINEDYEGKSKSIYIITEYDKNGKVLNTKKIESEDSDLEIE